MEDFPIGYRSIRTCRTFVRFFVGVRSSMRSQMIGTGEKSATTLTAEWFLARVTSKMASKVQIKLNEFI